MMTILLSISDAFQVNLCHHSRIYIGSVNITVNEDILRATFIPFGAIKMLSVNIDPSTGKHKGGWWRAFGWMGECMVVFGWMGECMVVLGWMGECMVVLGWMGECMVVLGWMGECMVVLGWMGECMVVFGWMGECMVVLGWMGECMVVLG